MDVRCTVKCPKILDQLLHKMHKMHFQLRSQVNVVQLPNKNKHKVTINIKSNMIISLIAQVH